MLKKLIYLSVLCTVFISFFFLYGNDNQLFTLQSSAFRNQGFIPTIYTCHGENISPPLSWSGAPWGTQSYALVCIDPDSPQGEFIHWLVYNIPTNVTTLNENAGQGEGLIPGAYMGKNSFQRSGYDGPCPPAGKPHHYIFTLYALDTVLQIEPGLFYMTFKEAAESHVLGKATFVGLFQMQGK